MNSSQRYSSDDIHLIRPARAPGIADDTALLMYGTINPALVPHKINIARGIVEQIWAGNLTARFAISHSSG